MDEMDHWLSQLPSKPPAEDLAGRVLSALRARRRRKARLHLGAGVLLALIGLWLIAAPLMEMVREMALPESGLPLLLAAWDLLLAGVMPFWEQILAGLASFEGSFGAALGYSAWLGMLALAFAALLSLGRLLRSGTGDWTGFNPDKE